MIVDLVTVLLVLALIAGLILLPRILKPTGRK